MHAKGKSAEWHHKKGRFRVQVYVIAHNSVGLFEPLKVRLTEFTKQLNDEHLHEKHHMWKPYLSSHQFF